MFGDVAKSLLKLMGHSTHVPGAIRAEDVPKALLQLKHALKADPSTIDKPNNRESDDTEDEVVSLKMRAFPLIELLEAAAASNSDVMWDQ